MTKMNKFERDQTELAFRAWLDWQFGVGAKPEIDYAIIGTCGWRPCGNERPDWATEIHKYRIKPSEPALTTSASFDRCVYISNDALQQLADLRFEMGTVRERISRMENDDTLLQSAITQLQNKFNELRERVTKLETIHGHGGGLLDN